MENKTSKYFKYAIGEIFLVVIGILIALQINNWNEERKDHNAERVLLYNLEQEFKKNLQELHSDHSINLELLEASYYFLQSDVHAMMPRQIDSLAAKMSVYATFDPSTGYIDQAINSSKLDLLQSDSLKVFLSQWSGELNDLREDVIIRREYWLNHFLPTMRKFIPVRNSDVTHYRPDYLREKQVMPKIVSQEHYEKFANSLEVDGVIYDHYMNQYYVVINEEHIEEYILDVLELITQELNKEP